MMQMEVIIAETLHQMVAQRRVDVGDEDLTCVHGSIFGCGDRIIQMASYVCLKRKKRQRVDVNNIYNRMEDRQHRDFMECIRSFMVRMRSATKDRLVGEQMQQNFTRLLLTNDTYEVIIKQLINSEVKDTNTHAQMLTLLHSLAKWTRDHYHALELRPAPMECIITQSIGLLSSQEDCSSLLGKQRELLYGLLTMPYTCTQIENYKWVVGQLKDMRHVFTSRDREQHRNFFTRCLQESLKVAGQVSAMPVLVFVCEDVVGQLLLEGIGSDVVLSRLRILKCVLKELWEMHEDIVYKIAYVIIKMSKDFLNYPPLLSAVVALYEEVMSWLVRKDCIIPLLLYTHVVVNNLVALQRKGGELLKLEIILTQLVKVFEPPYLEYFLRLYDWNFMEEDICHQSLNILYEYIEDTAHENKPEMQIYKRKLDTIHQLIQQHLTESNLIQRQSREQLHFYHLKKKEYFGIVDDMNSHPKRIFKKVGEIGNENMKEHHLHKYVRILKKSKHIKIESMINIVSSAHEVSDMLLQNYAHIFMKNEGSQPNLEEFIRTFTSNFFLSGEAQQIQRVIDKITQFYFRQQTSNYNLFKTSDAVYTFANAIIILNTDQHNPKHEDKMSQESFIKMCKTINAGEDLPLEMVKRTYHNIRKNQIHTFRNRFSMHEISMKSWLLLGKDYECIPLEYYDQEMSHITETCFEAYSADLLSSIIDEKETAKLEILIERFQYQDKKFQCDIIEITRKMVGSKPHIAMHALQKIYEVIDFKQMQPNDRTVSYCWLAANIIENFKQHLPPSKISEFLIKTWKFRYEFRDNLMMREIAEIKKIGQSIKDRKKRDSKKSFMEMFTMWISDKDQDDEEIYPPHQSPLLQKKINYSALTQSIFDILLQNQEQRLRAIEFIVLYIHNEQEKRFQEFLSCLYLIFNLAKDCSKQSILNVCESFFEEILGLRETSLTKRLQNLKSKDPKKYQIMETYCFYWILKLTYSSQNLRIIEKTSELLFKLNKDILIEFVELVQNKIPENIFAQNLLKSIQKSQLTEEKQFYSFYKSNRDKIKKSLNEQAPCQNSNTSIEKIEEQNITKKAVEEINQESQNFEKNKPDQIDEQKEQKKDIQAEKIETKRVDDQQSIEPRNTDVMEIDKKEEKEIDVKQSDSKKQSSQKSSQKAQQSETEVGMPIYML